MHDILIKGGTVVDGTGGEPQLADVAISGDRIVAVGHDLGEAREVIDATGKIVTPGFVDIHTHYDGQATWDQEMAPSSWHGVTTVVMGNCGVGFAPAAPDRHDWLIGLMEGVEDIPGSALSEGMTWNWESFDEYLTALESLPRCVDVATQVPHGAVRAYVMGERGAANEMPTETDMARMAAIVEEGLRAGALGFSTSRTILHKSIDGELVPGTTASKEELLTIGKAMGRVGHGVFELASDLEPEWNEFEWMGELSRENGVPVSFTALQSPLKAMSFDEQIAAMREQNAAGANVVAQVSMRATGLILGWRASFHPFAFKPSWKAIADLPWEAQYAKLSDPEFRAQLLAEPSDAMGGDLQLLADLMTGAFNMQYEMAEGFDYEPGPQESIAARAEAQGIDANAYAYDVLMRDQGNGFIYFPLLNYSDGNLDFLEPILRADDCVNSLSDGGAHCGTICDAAAPTFMLEHWVRDRSKGRIPLEMAIKRQCRDTARLYGLEDRGVLAPGYLADLNVIDLAAVKLNPPRVAFDLPAGGKRLLQTAEGYELTIKSGQVTFRGGEGQGVYPGGVIRGPQAAPEV
ncbi:MAG: amidohydrolase family protein, partial [Halieaceae bacterium]|nr:amidohydrolase family protein [Halieaceae bacterium]